MKKLLLLADFFDKLNIVKVTAEIDSNTTSDEGGGGVSRSSYGTRIWRGTVTLGPKPRISDDELISKLALLKEPDVKFELRPAWRGRGTGATGTIATISAEDRRVVTLSGSVNEGDIFGVKLGEKRSMHRVSLENEGVLTVVPALPFWAMVGNEVSFDSPVINAVLVSSSTPQYSPALTTNISFNWRQVP